MYSLHMSDKSPLISIRITDIQCPRTEDSKEKLLNSDAMLFFCWFHNGREWMEGWQNSLLAGHSLLDEVLLHLQEAKLATI